MQESRLFKIVYYLLEKGRTTAPRLAEKFEVSVRTIYRDIDALSGAGIPVYTEPGRSGGIYLMDDFVLDRAVLSKSEKQEILAALQSLNA
ncbi:MAG: HTH domain-containing protein, partial [Acetatifactor sp.]|nr:HTH domain-containing protein [Acetatifactor sp.]